MLQRSRDALADRKAQAQAAFARAGGCVEPPEFVEDLRQMMLGNARPGIPPLQFHCAVAYARGDQDAAFARVTQGVGEEILQCAAQQSAVAAYRAWRVRRTHA